MKCFRSLLMALALTGILCVSAGAYTGTFPVEADGQSTGVQACLMVPLRAVAEPLGFTVTWDDGGVLVDNGTLHTRVVIGQDRYTLTTSIDGLVGMSAPFSLGAPPYVANGVTYVPVALFDALLGDGAVTVTDSGTVSIQAPSSSSTSLANPFTEYDTLAQAEEAAGFSLQMPDRVPNWMDSMRFRVADDTMIEVLIQGGDQELCIRKAPGDSDISGDFTIYAWTQTVDADGITLELRGNGDYARVAIWTRDGYTFSITTNADLTPEAMTAMAESVA